MAAWALLLGARASEAHELVAAVATPDCDTSTIQLRFTGQYMENGPFSVPYEINLTCTDGTSTVIPGTASGDVTNNPPGFLAGTFDLTLTQAASALAGRTCLVSGTATLFQFGVQYNSVAITDSAGLTQFQVACAPPSECKCPINPAFLVARSGSFNNEADIRASLAANNVGGSILFGRRVTMADGTTLTGDSVRLGNGSSVDDVLADSLLLGRGAVVRGTSGAPTLPVITPFCGVPNIVCGSNDVLVSPGQTAGPLAPGTYGRLLVLNDGSITLSPGQFTFCEIRTGRRATIETLGQATLNVSGNVTIENSSSLKPAQGTDPILVNVAGGSVRLSDGADATAAFTAPNALITFGRDSNLLGCFCADRANTDKRITLDCPKP